MIYAYWTVIYKIKVTDISTKSVASLVNHKGLQNSAFLHIQMFKRIFMFWSENSSSRMAFLQVWTLLLMDHKPGWDAGMCMSCSTCASWNVFGHSNHHHQRSIVE